jgi:hypothetical protein
MSERLIENLRVELTDEERIAKGQQLARLNFRLAELKEQKAASARDFANQIKALELEGGQVARDADTGTEERAIELRKAPHWKDHVFEFFRVDTGELVRREPMTPQERQMKLEGVYGPLRPVKREPDPEPDGEEEKEPPVH